MAMYRVTYRSMTASYGPNFIEAEDEFHAKRIFAGTAFSRSEFDCIHAEEISTADIQRALRANSHGEDD